ncbi:hypothetical protein [Sinorhizobium medicae]
MPNLNLTLSLDSARNIQALLVGLEDERVRKGLLAQPKLPKDVQQLVNMIEDKKFLGMASGIVIAMQDLKKKDQDRSDAAILDLSKLGRKLTPPPSIEPIRIKGTELKDYMEANYPDAVGLLRRFGEEALAQNSGAEYGYFASNLQVAANAGAVVNAGVYTNVAVATMAVAAAAVVAVIAAVVV